MQVLQPGLSAFQPIFFAWEWRHSLISNFQRPLTHAGAADRLLTKITKVFEKAPRSAELVASFASFKSLVRMGQGFEEEALILSMGAVDAAPDNLHILRRHIQNLIHARKPHAAQAFCEKLCAIAPDVRIYKALLGTVYLNQKKRKKAMDVIAQSQIGKITFPAITLRQANGFLAIKQPESAEVLLDHVLPEIRWPDQFLDVQTTTKIELGKQNDIMAMLLSLQNDAGAVRNVSHLIAKVRRANNDLVGAAKDAKFAVEYGPKLGQYKALLATIYREMGREADADALIAQLPPMMQKRFLRR
jgi:predicted Zn-dependent protease